jgi:hypothetical protein
MVKRQDTGFRLIPTRNEGWNERMIEGMIEGRIEERIEWEQGGLLRL